jgi:hypothetical protein
MITEIGIVAGEIIHLLEETKRPLRLVEVEILINQPVIVVDMALGWLIREHYVRVVNMCADKYLFLSDQKTKAIAGCYAEVCNLN